MGALGFIAVLAESILVSAVIAIFIMLVVKRPLRLYHKWKVVKFTYKDGTFDYTVLRNGFLAMPFLYFPDKVTEEDGYLGTFYATEIEEDKAMGILNSRYEKYEKLCGKKVVEKNVIYEKK